FLQIVEKLLPLSNIVVIHVTSVPVDFSRVLDKKCESLPSNILLQIEDVIESYLLMNESYNTVNDNILTLLRIVEEIPKKFEKFVKIDLKD
ncbi:29811_t:CDS:2, partial [Gigaspora margarita]